MLAQSGLSKWKGCEFPHRQRSWRIGQARRALAARKTRNDAQAGDVPLETLLEESDIITLHCPLTVQTRDRIDATACARMKRWLLPINTARGGPVNEAALVDAAQCGDCALSAKRGNRIGAASA